MNTASARHVVQFSSGTGSAVAAKRVAERYGTDGLTLLFADVNGEDGDNYRFLREAAEWIGGELVVLDNAGRTIWQVFAESRFLGNTRVDLCSRVLKREPLRAWLDYQCDPAETVVHLGFDWTEGNRIDRAADYWAPWTVDTPLCWEPMLDKAQTIQTLTDAGVAPPRLTLMGFPHANCGGGCVKAGTKQWLQLLRLMPERYAEWEWHEERLREQLGDYAILRDRRGGTTKPLPLRVLRESTDPPLFDGACSCMAGTDEQDETP